MNKLQIRGEIIAIEDTRYTPAGIPVIRLTLHHVSEQSAAGMQRTVTCQMKVVAMGQQAEVLAGMPCGTEIMVSGFLARRSAKSQSLELHVQAFQRVETGNRQN